MSDKMLKELIAVVGMANETNRLVESYQVEVDEFVDQAEKKLFEISQNKKRSGFVSTAELATETIKII